MVLTLYKCEGPNMDAKIPSTTKFFDFSNLPNSFVCDPITEDEVYKFYS